MRLKPRNEYLKMLTLSPVVILPLPPLHNIDRICSHDTVYMKFPFCTRLGNILFHPINLRNCSDWEIKAVLLTYPKYNYLLLKGILCTAEDSLLGIAHHACIVFTPNNDINTKNEVFQQPFQIIYVFF